MSANISLFWELFKDMMWKNGWTLAISEKESYNRGDGCLRFFAEKTLERNKKVRLDISAWPSHTENNIFFIHLFRVRWIGRARVPVMGCMTLPYCGKEEWDSGEPSRSLHWVLEKPIDLLALIEAHDRIARATGMVQILN